MKKTSLRKFFLYSMSAVSALALFSACSSEEVVQDLDNTNTDEVEEPVTPVEWELTAAESRAADNMSGFNFDFFKAVCLTSGEAENVLASPLSAQILLAMVANTTDGAERAEIVSALGEDNMDALNNLCAKYIAGMTFCNDDARMSLVNALWYSDVYTLNPSFGTTLDEYFHTTARACDFQASEALIARINSWCDKSTNGLIPELFDRMPPLTEALLANAMYFSAPWREHFNEKNTKTETFTGTKGMSNVKMMHQSVLCSYLRGDGFSACEMPLCGNGQFAVWFVLPDDVADVNKMPATYNPAVLKNAGGTWCEVDLSLPKFAIKPAEPTILEEALRYMGINGIFETASNHMFTTELGGNWYVGQKNAVAFDENGLEAASVSYGGFETSNGSEPNYEKRELKLNRPFIFFITEKTSGTVLMAGKVLNI